MTLLTKKPQKIGQNITNFRRFKMKNRFEQLMNSLSNNTVLSNWFEPMTQALDKVRFSRGRFYRLEMDNFILLGCLRQLQEITTLREQVQSLFHLNEYSEQVPLARSTWSDAISSKLRSKVLRQAMEKLVESTLTTLPDRYQAIAELNDRNIYALDCTYQTESSHYQPIYPKEGGKDNQKGHLILTTYDLRKGVAIDVGAATESIGEMRFVKEQWEASHLTTKKKAIYVVDRAFIDKAYWNERKEKYQATVITRMKSTLKHELKQVLDTENSKDNDGVYQDLKIQLKGSNTPWRLIRFSAPSGEDYEYLTNDFSLKPGTVAFLYHRRWDEEKYFDAYKNDLASSKAWGKSLVSIEQQAMMGVISYLLTRLFLVKTSAELALDEDKMIQEKKYKKKKASYRVNSKEIRYRAYYSETSKITRQVWRFLKNCFIKKNRPALYERQLRPLLEGYI